MTVASPVTVATPDDTSRYLSRPAIVRDRRLEGSRGMTNWHSSCAALSAIQFGCNRVLIVEEEWEGGNGFFTAGAHRAAHGGLKDLISLSLRLAGAPSQRNTLHHGDGISLATTLGAWRRTDDWGSGGSHSTCGDAHASPSAGDRVLNNQFTKSGYSLGLMLGLRFVDERADFRNYTYMRFGCAIPVQPTGIAFQVYGAQAINEYNAAVEAYRTTHSHFKWDPAVKNAYYRYTHGGLSFENFLGARWEKIEAGVVLGRKVGKMAAKVAKNVNVARRT
ncbi:hypothetical protein DFH11DRAFT_1544100 [Phellopilus nigrolimitatus]|nr:hypothetical protein DFH11DRAFT_1544100 [Phellopilus nigrolimitatus]